MTWRASSFRCAVAAALMAVGGAGCGSNEATAGDGGTGGSGGTGGAPVNCGDPAGPIDPTALIDDMEATDPLLPMIGGRTGGWWAGGDTESVGASITPDGDVAAEPIPGGRCGSQHGIRVTGQGFTAWAVLSASLRWGAVDGGAEMVLPYDAHIRTGIRFWARVGDTSSNQVRFAVSDRYSRPEGGLCVLGGSIDDACYDTHGAELAGLATTWKEFQIPFAGLTQRQFGLPRPEGLDSSALYTVEFQLPPGSVFDFWLDDISFY